MALTDKRGSVLVALIGVWLGVTAPALAQPASSAGQGKDNADTAARKLFEEGRRAFDLGEWQRAITAYKGAYNLKPDAAFLYNIAQAYRLANDPAQAIFFYKSFLRNRPSAPNRAEIEERIRQLEVASGKPAEAAAGPPPTSPPPPTATPEAPLARPAAHSAAVTEPSGAPAAGPPSLGAPPVGADATAVATLAPPPSEPPLYKRPWAWGVAGAVVAGVVIGVVVASSSGGAAPPKTALGSKPVF